MKSGFCKIKAQTLHYQQFPADRVFWISRVARLLRAGFARGSMISLKKYLDSEPAGPDLQTNPAKWDILTVTMAAYRSALKEMGSCGIEACPALGCGLKQKLEAVGEVLCRQSSPETVRAAESEVRTHLQEWGQQTAKHYREKTGEVKELLLVLARTAESVGDRDQRCAGQITEVTARLEGIASLDDLGEIRASIERSALELKTSVERMTAESKSAIDQLQAEVSVYQARLEEAEEAASRDPLTGVRSRLYAENVHAHYSRTSCTRPPRRTPLPSAHCGDSQQQY